MSSDGCVHTTGDATLQEPAPPSRAGGAARVGRATCLEDGVVLEADDALLRLLGLARQQVVGRTLEALLDGHLSVGSRGSADRYERSARLVDGTLAWVRVSRSRVTAADGQVLLVQSVEDLTETKARERDGTRTDPGVDSP